MCVHKARPSAPTVDYTYAASAQGKAQDNTTNAAVMMNQQRVRRHYGLDSTITGAGVGSSGIGVGTKTGLGM